MKKSGVELIAEERKRQIEIENYSPERDLDYIDEQLARAASVYAKPGYLRAFHEKGNSAFAVPGTPVGWPWPLHTWKPSPDNRIKELCKAGALIAAEIDRLQTE